MDSRLKDLTEKLYKEGVTKAQEEAEKMLELTKKQIAQMQSEAQAKADAIVTQAHEEAATIAKNGQSELKLASTQAVSALKQEIINLLGESTITSAVQASMKDEKFVQTLISDTVASWAKQEDVTLFLDSTKGDTIKSYFAKNAKEVLDKGLTIDSSTKIKGGFKIGPSDGSYKVSFTDEDFANYFKEYLRPSMVALLFPNKNN